MPSVKAFTNYSLETMALMFAEDKKAQMALKTLFYLVHKHGDNLREVYFYLLIKINFIINCFFF